MSHYVKYVSALSAGALMGCSQFALAPTDGAPKMQPVARITSPVSEVEELFILGRKAHGLRQLDVAEGRYAKVLILQPEHVGALNAMAVIYAQTQRPEPAYALFERALAIDPNAAFVHNNYGYALMMAGRLESAQAQLDRAQALNPASVLTLKNQALLAQVKGIALALTTPKTTTPKPVASEGPQLVAVQANVYELRDPLKIEVSNGVGIPNLARRTAQRLAPLGVVTARLTNQPGYKQVATEIFYRPGQWEAARALSDKLPMAAKVIAAHDMDARVQVRLVLGRDLDLNALATWLDGLGAPLAESPPVAHSPIGAARIQHEDDHARDHSSPLPLVALCGEGAIDLGV